MAGGRLSPARAIVVARKGQVTANSRDVAELFGKEHRNVLQSIDRLECSEKFTALNFQLSTDTDPTGRKLRAFDITKDGFVFLVMGFIGKQAAQFKEAYIEGSIRMELGRVRKRSRSTSRAGSTRRTADDPYAEIIGLYIISCRSFVETARHRPHIIS